MKLWSEIIAEILSCKKIYLMLGFMTALLVAAIFYVYKKSDGDSPGPLKVSIYPKNFEECKEVKGEISEKFPRECKFHDLKFTEVVRDKQNFDPKSQRSEVCRDQEYGYEIRYPANFRIKAGGCGYGGYVVFGREGPDPADYYRYDLFTVIAFAGNLETYINATSTNLVHKNLGESQLDGKKGVIFEDCNDYYYYYGCTRTSYVENNGAVFALSDSPWTNLEDYQSFIANFKFFKPPLKHQFESRTLGLSFEYAEVLHHGSHNDLQSNRNSQIKIYYQEYKYDDLKYGASGEPQMLTKALRDRIKAKRSCVIEKNEFFPTNIINSNLCKALVKDDRIIVYAIGYNKAFEGLPYIKNMILIFDDSKTLTLWNIIPGGLYSKAEEAELEKFEKENPNHDWPGGPEYKVFYESYDKLIQNELLNPSPEIRSGMQFLKEVSESINFL